MTDYLTPTTVEEAVNLLIAHDGQAMLIAGGTDVLPDIRKGKRTPGCLVDVTRIPALTQIEVGGGYITVGTAVTFSMLYASTRTCASTSTHLSRRPPPSALRRSNPPRRGAATWCRPCSRLTAPSSRSHMGAELRVVDRQGERWIPVLDSFAGPGRSHIDPTRRLITTIRFPIPATPWGTAWRRAGRRPSLILPTRTVRSSSC